MKCYNSVEEVRVDNLEEELIAKLQDMQKADDIKIKSELENAHKLLDLYASAIEDYNALETSYGVFDFPPLQEKGKS